ncbi:D-isomer specific 2-hydroxyacid dehydrogenase, NAD-binding protein [Paraglaciecola sp. T6c]|uniref:2-hydroxyacid dehydrogenase n=1 Tax=Pseudoalteromonas atlantica (strain T6c / ATCC BAA-1087) TaxID=3042615 RepID=UPI00005C6E2D|nr:glyoxylate/hydroxypyruvate reductase A [Paraglaciecola sp. T6c]ABG39970.1 D-isomer specific 2-hydroxyacid dehydrogenase, NAD-binding protein [Paraglaciecola sp. T6c]
MTTHVLFRGPQSRNDTWQALFADALPNVAWHHWPHVENKDAIELMIVWKLPRDYQQDYPNLKVIFSVGAGVDQLDLASVPEHIQVVRMLDPGIAKGMSEFIAMHVLNIHRDTFAYINANKTGSWRPMPTVANKQRRVGILGLGNLGQAAAQTVLQLGFSVNGWSRRPKHVEQVTCFSGDAELESFLAQTDILVCLVPLTPETRGILNAKTLSQLPKGASVINVGRGEQLVPDDLMTLLDAQHLSYAVLDVFEIEPLPETHPLWQHPQVLVTPHIAAITQDDSAGQVLVSNVQRYINKQALIGLVDRDRGY